MSEIPKRPGNTPWGAQHIRAARLRAEGMTWAKIAQRVHRKTSTVEGYTQLDGWDELYDHCLQARWDAEQERVWLVNQRALDDLELTAGVLREHVTLLAEQDDFDGELLPYVARLAIIAGERLKLTGYATYAAQVAQWRAGERTKTLAEQAHAQQTTTLADLLGTLPVHVQRGLLRVFEGLPYEDEGMSGEEE